MVARNEAWVCSRSHGQPCGERRRRTTSTSCRLRSPPSATVLVAGSVRRGFDLPQPFGVERATPPDQRGPRLDGAEDFAVRPADLTPATRRRREDSGTRHVIEAGSDAGQRLADDAKALSRLLVDVPLAHRRAVVRGWCAAADLDRRTNANRARIADDGLPLAARGEDATRRHGDHAR